MHDGILLRCRGRDPSSFLPNLYFRWSDGQSRVPLLMLGHPRHCMTTSSNHNADRG